MAKISLYAYPTSPYAQKVGCYLKFKNLDYTFVGVNPINNAQIAFTKQRKVPILKIDEQWRKESTDIGLWLDEVFPEKPLLPEDIDLRTKLMSIEQWINSALIPGYFRNAVEWQSNWHSIRNGWILARAVNHFTPLPFFIRLIWPIAIRKAKFIVRLMDEVDLSESFSAMVHRLQDEFKQHLGQGPYLGGQTSPSLADLSAFPIVCSGTLMGMKRKYSIIDDHEINSWALRVASHLPKNPLLVPDSLLTPFS